MNHIYIGNQVKVCRGMFEDKMRLKQMSYLGIVSIFAITSIIAGSIAAMAGIMFGLSMLEMVFSMMLIILILLIMHVILIMNAGSEQTGDASIDQKITFIAAEISLLRKQQAHLRQHFDHELKYMHGLNRTTDDNFKRLNDDIEKSLVKILNEARSFSVKNQRIADLPLSANKNKLQQAVDDDEIVFGEKIQFSLDEERDDALIEMLSQSLADNKVDLYAQPIVTLPARHIAYYESYTWVRDGNGKIITPREYLDVAERAGIMPVIDNLMLFRSVLLARRFVERNRDLKIFCNISGHSLLDVTFFDQFIEFMENNKEQAKLLIFEFSQKTLADTGIVESEALLSLKELGFRFSLDNVTDLNIDFRKLHALGFRYLKISANIFLNNAEAHGAQILVNDFAEHVKRSGLELIIDGVQNEHIIPELLNYNVQFAQGYLFGEPTLVRDKSHLLDDLKKIA